MAYKKSSISPITDYFTVGMKMAEGGLHDFNDGWDCRIQIAGIMDSHVVGWYDDKLMPECAYRVYWGIDTMKMQVAVNMSTGARKSLTVILELDEEYLKEKFLSVSSEVRGAPQVFLGYAFACALELKRVNSL